MIETVAALAEEIRRSYLERPFGIAKFWGLSVLPPNDQSYQLVAAHADGDRLDLTFVHESRAGRASVLSVWQPAGLSGPGLTIQRAARLRLGSAQHNGAPSTDETDAALEPDGATFRARTARGEGTMPTEGAPALVLTR